MVFFNEGKRFTTKWWCFLFAPFHPSKQGEFGNYKKKNWFKNSLFSLKFKFILWDFQLIYHANVSDVVVRRRYLFIPFHYTQNNRSPNYWFLFQKTKQKGYWFPFFLFDLNIQSSKKIACCMRCPFLSLQQSYVSSISLLQHINYVIVGRETTAPDFDNCTLINK